MPKRTKTPPPPDDEPRYLTVVHPYPLHANMELEADQKEFVYWLACCIGKDPLLAFFHKPSSPNMVIIEVLRSFNDWARLLGAHRWSEILSRPTPEQKDRVSKIFYCTYSTGREVQKYGWKRIYVEESWFRNWRPHNVCITRPYPPTHWCERPAEDKTNSPLCRHLPTAVHRPPPPPRLPPVGTPEWAAMKKVEEQKLKVKPASVWAKPPNIPGPSRARGPFSSGIGSSNPSANPMGRGPPVSPPGLLRPPGISAPTPVLASTPQGAVWANSSTTNNFADELVDSPSTPALIRESLSGSATSSDEDREIVSPTTQEEDEAAIAGEDFTQAMAEVANEDGLWAVAGSDAWGEIRIPEPVPESQQSLWEGYGEEEDPEPEQDICIAHGKICKRGICQEYSAQRRKSERAKEAAKRAMLDAEKDEQRKTGKDKKKSGVGLTTKAKFSMNPPKPNARTPNRSTWGIPTPNAVNTPPSIKPPQAGAPAPATSGSGAATPEPSDPTPRVARGRKKNTKPTTNNIPVDTTASHGTLKASDVELVAAGSGSKPIAKSPPSVAGSSNNGGWGNPSVGPWGGSGSANDPWAEVRNRASAPSVKPPPSVAGSSNNGGWGNPSVGPWGSGRSADEPWAKVRSHTAASSVKPPPSIAASSNNGGWGNPSVGPWESGGSSALKDDARSTAGGRRSAPSAWAKGKVNGGTVKRSWADEVQDEEDALSVAPSTNGGWGTISNGPW